MRTILALSALALAAAAPLPKPATDMPAAAGPQTLTVSGGCFWGVQGVFEHVAGVTRAVSGYAGGDAKAADYETVSTGTTGHAESVQITYDPAKISMGELLRIFFTVALDPTEVDRQGPDEGPQYRSEIWVTSPVQQRVAQAYIAQLEAAHTFPRPIATRVDTLPSFTAAEPYHQDFLVRNPDYPYIVVNDLPKVQALQAAFPEHYRAEPVLSNNAS